MTTFSLIGAAGFVAPRHMKAMKAVGGLLEAAYDPNDSVGVLDSHFPEASFFTEFEQFDRHCGDLRRAGRRIDYVSICSPNYLHDAHCRFGLRSGSDVICEKPLALDPWELDGIAAAEQEAGRTVSTILQLRLHPVIRQLKEAVSASGRRHAVDLTYIASRGRWYHASWKGVDAKSGGVATNIGVHFFDMLIDLFGPLQQQRAHLRTASAAAGFLACERADVRWFLSVDRNDLPDSVRGTKTTYRSVTVDGVEIEFSEGFEDLHARSYEEIMAGRGFGIADVRASIEVVSGFRALPLVTGGETHPLARARAGIT
jgi:UDP-N-acetyl-2-amino-2-deoxyglucuronate dehydrogenase